MLFSHSRRLAVLAIVLTLAPLASSRGADDLETRIKEVITRPEYKQARWGILVIDAETGKAVCERNADQLFAPASVTKLYTCAAALIALGPDHKFRTPVYRRGTVAEGVLKGDLILVAQGDPTLGGRTDAGGHLAFKNSDHTYASFVSTTAELIDIDPLAGLRALARQVRESGIRKVEGDVLIDNRLFALSFSSGSGPKIVTPIAINDNVVDVVFSPGKAVGEPASMRIRPRTELVQIDVQVETVAKDQKPKITVELVGPGRYVVRGRIPLESKPLVRICPIADPEAFARALFIDALKREGIAIRVSGLRLPTATLPEKDAYAGLTAIAHYESPPLSELVKVILKVSHNLYASTLPLLIAAKHGKRTLAEGLALEGKILSDLGVDVKSIALESGAGGGMCDRVTPRATVQLLRAMSRRPEFGVYRAALPVLGVDGTLASSVAEDSPARGKALAKTGTYIDTDLLNDRMYLRSKSLAGVMTTKSGRHLLFALFVNDVPLAAGVQSTREGKALGRLCEIFYEHTP